jgi:hypothetical protein
MILKETYSLEFFNSLREKTSDVFTKVDTDSLLSVLPKNRR